MRRGKESERAGHNRVDDVMTVIIIINKGEWS